MEYCGEVISPVEFEERKKQYTIEKRRHYYFMSLRSDEVHMQCLVDLNQLSCSSSSCVERSPRVLSDWV